MKARLGKVFIPSVPAALMRSFHLAVANVLTPQTETSRELCPGPVNAGFPASGLPHC